MTVVTGFCQYCFNIIGHGVGVANVVRLISCGNIFRWMKKLNNYKYTGQNQRSIFQNFFKHGYLFYLVKISPVISGGTGSCISVKMVGAISPNFPGFKLSLLTLSITKSGTGFKVCAVLAVPSSFII